jgi:hypothetical protein
VQRHESTEAAIDAVGNRHEAAQMRLLLVLVFEGV